MTKEQMPDYLDDAPQEARDFWNNLSEEDKRMNRLMRAVRAGLDGALAERQRDGTVRCVVCMQEAVTVFRKCMAFYMGMSKQFDKPEAIIEYLLEEIVPETFKDVMSFRSVMRGTKLPPHIQIIDAADYPDRPN